LSQHDVIARGRAATPGLQPSIPPQHPLAALSLGAMLEVVPVWMVDEAVTACGRLQERVRALPSRATVYFTLVLWLRPGEGYAEVLRTLFAQLRDGTGHMQWRVPTSSAAVKARQRLGPAPLRVLFEQLRGAHAALHEPGMSAFGRTLALLKVSVDGTTLDVADTAANRTAFGDPPRNGKGAGGRYPKIRLVMLVACGTRAIVDAAWAGFATGELALLGKLVRRGAIRPGMLVLADRYFSGHPQVAQVVAAGADLLFRAQNNRNLPVVEELPDGSYLSILPSANLPSAGDRLRAGSGHCPRLGIRKRQARGLRIRVIHATVTAAGEDGEPRTESYLLLTTLLDARAAPAAQLVALYHERWESETGYADLKTYLRARQDVLRSKAPAGVAQELYALLIVYQIVQIVRARAAREHPAHAQVDPDRISFTVTLRAMRRTVGMYGPEDGLLELVLAEIWGQPLIERRPRSKPRELKGTPAFARAVERTPPGRMTYVISTREPRLPTSP